LIEKNFNKQSLDNKIILKESLHSKHRVVIYFFIY